jgi:hypothetical protein
MQPLTYITPVFRITWPAQNGYWVLCIYVLCHTVTKFKLFPTLSFTVQYRRIMLCMLYIRMFKRIFKVRLLFLTIRMRDIKLTFERVILKTGVSTCSKNSNASIICDKISSSIKSTSIDRSIKLTPMQWSTFWNTCIYRSELVLLTPFMK